MKKFREIKSPQLKNENVVLRYKLFLENIMVRVPFSPIKKGYLYKYSGVLIQTAVIYTYLLIIMIG